MISVAESMARRPDVKLRLPKPGFDDYIITNLLNIINFAFDNPEQTSQLLVDELSVLLMCHLIHDYSDVSPIERSRGGLASWQERIAKEILFARICNPPTANELGQACGVSARHFIRAFRQSTGRTPHQWLMQERALNAKNLLEHSDRTLAEISAMCGYANLSHFCRAFLKVLWSEPVDGKAAGKGERYEWLTDRQAGAQAGHATSASIFKSASSIARPSNYGDALRAPRRRVLLVEGGSTRIIVDESGS